MRNNTIKRLRESLPPLLTVQQYCRLMSCCEAIAYHNLRDKPGIAVKVGGSTRFVTDMVLDEMERLPEWTPQKYRVGAASKYPSAKVVASKKSTRSQKQTAAARREPDPEARP